jgi:hypothetical protein
VAHSHSKIRTTPKPDCGISSMWFHQSV